MIEQLQPWQPEPGRPPERYAPSNICALRFVLDYAMGSSRSVSPDDYGQWPPPYTLFAPLVKDGTIDETACRLLIEKLFDARLKTLPNYARPFAPTGGTVIDVLWADLIEVWHQILLGDADPVAPEASALLDVLLKHIAQVTDRKTQKALLARWRRRSSHMLTQRSKTQDRPEKKRLGAHRRSVRDLLKRFSQFRGGDAAMQPT